MSLDIFVTAIADPRRLGALEPRLSLEDDGLLRCIQQFAGSITSSAGQSIDAYGHAVFEAESLGALQAAFARAHAHFKNGPERLSVWVGTEVKPQHRELHETVRREHVLAALSTLNGLATEAVTAGQFLVFVGD